MTAQAAPKYPSSNLDGPEKPMHLSDNIALSSRSKWTTKRETRISPSIAEELERRRPQTPRHSPCRVSRKRLKRANPRNREPRTETLSSIVETTRAETTPALASGPQVPLSETKPENTIHSETKPRLRPSKPRFFRETTQGTAKIEILPQPDLSQRPNSRPNPSLQRFPMEQPHESREPKDDTETETQELLKLLPSHYHATSTSFPRSKEPRHCRHIEPTTCESIFDLRRNYP
ncbi:hypothetical protein EHS25_005135 [Saitozyma podzolica]|uniref:Uncharacterized protein n=1 Tax=Saitozyma podzolica TaxID=1890683 RepID=A0A427XYI4_9TREE|nr:hypothetical protein EHS25_005135 [Saitozyma podzolica]